MSLVFTDTNLSAPAPVLSLGCEGRGHTRSSGSLSSDRRGVFSSGACSTLGPTTFLQFFDAKFYGELEQVELTINGLYPGT